MFNIISTLLCEIMTTTAAGGAVVYHPSAMLEMKKEFLTRNLNETMISI